MDCTAVKRHAFVPWYLLLFSSGGVSFQMSEVAG